MTKNPRDHRMWTNMEVQEDSTGYLGAQQAYHEDQAKASEERAYQDDLKSYRDAFVASGGEEEAAEAAFKAYRNEQAAIAAAQIDEEARQQVRRHVERAL